MIQIERFCGRRNNCRVFQGLSNPHDVVVSRDGREVYVAEIGPNKIWKFENSEFPKADLCAWYHGNNFTALAHTDTLFL